MKILPCAKRWNFASIDLSTRMVRTCVRAFGPVASREDVANSGKNIFLNHPYMQKGRELMLKGEYQDDCKGCYALLDSGYDGFRTSYEQTLLQLAGTYKETPASLDKNFKASPFDPKYLKSQSAIELEVSFGNICDMMCIYCSSSYSSLIEAEDRKWNTTIPGFQRDTVENNSDFLEAFWTWLEEDSLQSIKDIHLIGGETLFNNYFYKFIETLDKIYRKKKFAHEIGVNVFSNLNNKTSVQKFINSVRNMHPNFKIRLMFSCESVGKKAEFIRSGLNWNDARSNLEKLLKVKRIETGFSPSFNCLSISSITDFLSFIKEMKKLSPEKMYCGDNYISWPDGHSPLILTVDFIPFLDEALRFVKDHGKTFLRDESAAILLNRCESIKETILRNHANPTEELLRHRQDFFRRINLLKERRSADFEVTFPEYMEFYNLCGSLQRQ